MSLIIASLFLFTLAYNDQISLIFLFYALKIPFHICEIISLFMVFAIFLFAAAIHHLQHIRPASFEEPRN